MKKAKDKPELEIFKRINRLKLRLGSEPDDPPGRIDPDLMEEADALIEKMCENCPQLIGSGLGELIEKWEEMRDMPRSDGRQALAKQIFTISHEIKDIGATCGYDLMAHFAESLRDYIVLTDLSLEAQRVIIQAHVDAMMTVHKQELKADGGEAAEELKKLVKKAIEQYS